MPIRTLVTLTDYLNDRKALFNERGMIAVWNELKTLITATVSGTPTVLGPTNLVTNYAPDMVERAPASGRPNDLAGGTIVDAQPQSI